MEKNMIRSLLREKPILINKTLLKICNRSYAAAAFLAQAIYWEETMGREFYKTNEDWKEELCIGDDSFDTARRVAGRFVKCERKGLPYKNYYRVCWDEIEAAINNLYDNGEVKSVHSNSNTFEKDKISTSPIDPACRISNDPACRVSDETACRVSITENTTEITTERKDYVDSAIATSTSRIGGFEKSNVLPQKKKSAPVAAKKIEEKKVIPIAEESESLFPELSVANSLVVDSVRRKGGEDDKFLIFGEIHNREMRDNFLRWAAFTFILYYRNRMKFIMDPKTQMEDFMQTFIREFYAFKTKHRNEKFYEDYGNVALYFFAAIHNYYQFALANNMFLTDIHDRRIAGKYICSYIPFLVKRKYATYMPSMEQLKSYLDQVEKDSITTDDFPPYQIGWWRQDLKDYREKGIPMPYSVEFIKSIP